LNSKHDGKLVEFPLEAIDNEVVYQRRINNKIDDTYVQHIRIPVLNKEIPKEIPFVYLRHRPVHDRFGARGFLGSNSPLNTFRLDQMVIGLSLTPVALGISVSALSFTSLPKFVAQSLASVAPYIANSGDRKLASKTMWRFFVATSINLLVAMLIALAAEPLVLPLFGDAFLDSVPVVQILLVSAVVIGARRVLSEGMRAMGFPGVGSTAEAVSWIFLVASLAVLAPYWQLIGIAVSIVLSNAVSLGSVLHRALGGESRMAPEVNGSITLPNEL